jgi:hypothetical protein
VFSLVYPLHFLAFYCGATDFGKNEQLCATMELESRVLVVGRDDGCAVRCRK